jgi:DNA ligase-associated metallophosphoesterase
MNYHAFEFAGVTLKACASGALYWPDAGLLCVSDLHLGKSDRIARRSGVMLPPYETGDTLARLEADIRATNAKTVICLGDSFDDPQAANALDEEETLWLTRLMAGRSWIWIEGNHDPGPLRFGGSYVAQFSTDPLVFRHVAEVDARGEISGHYHPKITLLVKGRTLSRRCFLYDDTRLILPAYGTYTGGLRTTDPVLSDLMRSCATAVMVGETPRAIPMPRTVEAKVS